MAAPRKPGGFRITLFQGRQNHLVLRLHQLLALTLLSKERLRISVMLSSTCSCIDAMADTKNWFFDARAIAR